MKSIIAIVGPTASGKTDLALELALALDTEIVSADSMQFYRGMEIGTGQPSPEQLARVPHHFIGHLAPDAFMSAADYAEAAREVVARLNAAGKPAIVAGGSGLYLRALIDGLFEGPGRSCDIRQRLHAQADTQGIPALYAQLQAQDPTYAATVYPGDLRRIVRALEVHELTGKPLSAHHAEQKNRALGLSASSHQPASGAPTGPIGSTERRGHPHTVIARSGVCDEAISRTEDREFSSAIGSSQTNNPGFETASIGPIGPIGPILPILPISPIPPNPTQPLDAIQFALDWPREVLYQRINRRVQAMFDAGLIDEVKTLQKSGHETQMQRLKSLGYREVLAHLRGETTLEQTIAAIQMHHRRYAKRQLTWFRRDTRIHWLRMDGPAETFHPKTVAECVTQTLAESLK